MNMITRKCTTTLVKSPTQHIIAHLQTLWKGWAHSAPLSSYCSNALTTPSVVTVWHPAGSAGRFSRSAVHMFTLHYSSKAEHHPKSCPGCGAAFQHHSPISAGYVPAEAYARKTAITPASIHKLKNSTEPLTPSQVKILINASKQKKDIPICQRCHNLKHHNYSQVPASFHTNHSQFKSLKTHVGGLVVLIVDIYDLPCTLLSNLRDLVGIKNVIVAINKSDLIPRLEDPRIYVDWVRRRIQGGARTVSIVPISARLGTGIDDLISAIVHNRKPNEDIYMMGVTNVGKSAVINQMITHAGHDAFLTTSNFAGTTLSPIPVPLSSFGPLFFPNYVGDISDPDHDIYKDKGRMIDTAGAYNYQQLTHFLDSSEFQLVVPKHPIKPRKILLKPGYSVWFGALVRFEVIETKVASHFWYYGCNDFPIHACKESKVRSLWEEHAGVSKDLLTPPFGKDRINLLPPFSVALESRYKGGLKEGVRIWLGGLGWIVLYGQVHFRMWTPGGVGIHMDTDSSPTNARKIVL